MIAAFLQHMASERRLSLHTVQAYATDLKQCAAYLHTLDPDSQLEQATHQSLRAWIAALAQQGLSNRSINRKIAALKAFYKFLHNQGHIVRDPTVQLSRLKQKKFLPVFLKEKELLDLLDGHEFENTFEGWRDRLILELLYGTGIRLAELLSLQDAAVDLYDNMIRVQGKRNKERVIPFPKSLRQVIEQYRVHRDATVSNTHGLLLVTATGAACYPMLVYRLVRKYLRQYTHADRYSPHVLRHTFATHLLNKGADLNAIKDLLGHESLAATQLYTHHSLKKLKEVFQQAHPRA
ncbi:MAG: tyrosine-type recombinase/integrase [Bacteroidota bacterium]